MLDDDFTEQIGMIVKSVGGSFYVQLPDGIRICKARGVFRNVGISPCTGDFAAVSDDVITQIMPRKNYLIRPPLANLDILAFVVSATEPSPNLVLIDKFAAIAEYKKIEPAIIITKADMDDYYQQLYEIYSHAGIVTYIADYRDAESIDRIKMYLKGKISAFTGNSGVGKSTLLNALNPELSLPVGEISHKLGRGRHTTRHAELYRLPEGGYIADTPGFSTLDTLKYDRIKKEDLAECFREFADYPSECKFTDCSHTKEKGCAVIRAVDNGDIGESRYKSYCIMYQDAMQIKEWEK